MIEHCLEPLAEAASYTVTVRGLVLMCSIGIRRREREHKQRVRVSVDLTSTPQPPFPAKTGAASSITKRSLQRSAR